MTEHAILIHISLSAEPVGTQAEQNMIGKCMEELKGVLEDSSKGEFDGYEFGEGKCTIYLYGAEADQLFNAVKPVLDKTRFTKGSFLTKRYGGPGDADVKMVDVTL